MHRTVTHFITKADAPRIRAFLLGCLLCILIVAPVGIFPAPILADSRSEAFDLESGELLFRGFTQSRIADGIVTERTEYATPDGGKVKTAEVSYSDADLKLISFKAVDLRTGETEAMQVQQDTVTLAYREDAEAETEHDEVAWTAETAFSDSISVMIRRAWDALHKGETLVMDLLVPSRLETVRFRIVREGEAESNGEKLTVMRMEPDTWLIRQLVDPLRFYYANTPPYRLVEYRGRSSVTTAEGDPIDARWVYHPVE